MKRFLIILLSLLFSLALLASCDFGAADDSPDDPCAHADGNGDKLCDACGENMEEDIAGDSGSGGGGDNGTDTNPDDDQKDDDDMNGDIKDEFITSVTITNGYGGANGIVVLMTDNDSGAFDTIERLDKLYAKYGLVGGIGMVAKNLYSDSDYTVPKENDVALWQEFLDTGRWSVICHSLTHGRHGSETEDGTGFIIDKEKVFSEVVTSAELLRELFPDERVATYVPPGAGSAINNHDPSYRDYERELVRKYYIGARFTYAGAQDFEDLDFHSLPFTLLSTGNLSNILSNIDKCASEGKYYMVYNHYVIEDELIDTVNQSSWTTLSAAEALCKRVSGYVQSGKIWNAQLEDAVMYMRERDTASVQASYKDGAVYITLQDELDDEIFYHPLTLEVKVPEEWEAVKIVQGDRVSYAKVNFKPAFGGDSYVALCDIVPNGIEATVTPCSLDDIPKEEATTPAPTPSITPDSDSTGGEVAPPSNKDSDVDDGAWI